MPEEASQIAEERREAKGQGEKKRHTHLNGEVQRTARKAKNLYDDLKKKYREESEGTSFNSSHG